MKKTAVEQFLYAIKDQISLNSEHLGMIESYASQAKEMEKQQAERMYSEEDMKLAWENGRNGTSTVGSFPFVTVKFIHNSFKEWFEQFKKK